MSMCTYSVLKCDTCGRQVTSQQQKDRCQCVVQKPCTVMYVPYSQTMCNDGSKCLNIQIPCEAIQPCPKCASPTCPNKPCGSPTCVKCNTPTWSKCGSPNCTKCATARPPNCGSPSCQRCGAGNITKCKAPVCTNPATAICQKCGFATCAKCASGPCPTCTPGICVRCTSVLCVKCTSAPCQKCASANCATCAFIMCAKCTSTPCTRCTHCPKCTSVLCVKCASSSCPKCASANCPTCSYAMCSRCASTPCVKCTTGICIKCTSVLCVKCASSPCPKCSATKCPTCAYAICTKCTSTPCMRCAPCPKCASTNCPSKNCNTISPVKTIAQSAWINKSMLYLLGCCLPFCAQNTNPCKPLMVCLPSPGQIIEKKTQPEEEIKPIGLITRNKEADFIGGRFIYGCTCGRKNGLQGDCPRISCQNNPGCHMNPPRCWPQFKEPVKPPVPPDQKMVCVPIQLVYYDPNNR